MPQGVVRRRRGRRSGGQAFQLRRWIYRRRPQLAVVAAFVIAGVLGLVAASVGVKSLDGMSQAEAQP